MKLLFCLFSIFLAPSFSYALPLLERELFNARNGETYVCRIHESLQTELLHEGLSVGEFPTEFTTKSEKVREWTEEMRNTVQRNQIKLSSKIITEYVHRGFKNYSIYKNNRKIPFYQLSQHVRPRRQRQKEQLGSLVKQAEGKNTLTQQLRGQIDEACKAALLKL